ncbi:hypothetical protein ACIB24_16040 [Spongisporangium articulatum]|uniref:Uncharacterized protein n=1 Tax=Spongisporangium articulatum TaxID=3362603 RepID=A0ABW8AQD3_9ACTN
MFRKIISSLRARTSNLERSDAGHEAVGQALLISIGVAGMLAAGRLAEVSTTGMQTLMDALNR